MAIMDRNTIKSFNNKMLGLGAPVVIDGQGYNKVDYSKMLDFSNKDFNYLTDRQLWFVAITLGKYKNTQLTEYKDDLEDTIAHYANTTTKKPQVNVVGTSLEEISLQWKFNKEVSESLKNQLDKSKYRWTKDEGVWTLHVQWGYVPTMVKSFQNAKLDTSLVGAAYKNRPMNPPPSDPNPSKSSKKAVPSKPTTSLKVTRSTTSPDTLELVSGFNQGANEAYKSVGGIYTKKTNTWSIYIERAADLYALLPDSVNKTQLKPWADLVNGWASSHTLVDYTQLPLKFQPYTFQPQDAQRLLQLKVGLNANEVGCGKTFEMVLVGESIPMKKLVICPATLRLNWEREIKMVNPNAVVHIQYSDQPFKVVDGWNIIGYPSLTKFQEQLEAEMFQVVMSDEAHYIQAVNNYGKPSSKRANAVLRIAATAQYVYPITGTPKTNRNLNLYNILRMMRHPLTRGRFAFSKYGDYYCNGQATPWGMDYSGNSHDGELSEKLSPLMVRHLKRDVLPYLKKQRQSIPVKVNLREYFKAIDEYMEARKTSEAEALVALTRAKQVVAIQKAKHTIEFAKNIIDRGEKVVITTSFTEVVNQMTKAFDGCLKIVGGMSDKQKQVAIDEFQNGSAQVIVINYEAGGVGVTLTAASTMIINDLHFVPGAVDQAEGRIWRAGQTKTAMIYYMVAASCPMDERLVDMIVSKSQTINRVVDKGLGDEIDLRKLLEECLVG